MEKEFNHLLSIGHRRSPQADYASGVLLLLYSGFPRLTSSNLRFASFLAMTRRSASVLSTTRGCQRQAGMGGQARPKRGPSTGSGTYRPGTPTLNRDGRGGTAKTRGSGRPRDGLNA